MLVLPEDEQHVYTCTQQIARQNFRLNSTLPASLEGDDKRGLRGVRSIVLRVPAAARCGQCRSLSEINRDRRAKDIISAQYCVLIAFLFAACTLESNHNTVLDAHLARTALRTAQSNTLISPPAQSLPIST
jgi:hypothetical protein